MKCSNVYFDVLKLNFGLELIGARTTKISHMTGTNLVTLIVWR